MLRVPLKIMLTLSKGPYYGVHMCTVLKDLSKLNSYVLSILVVAYLRSLQVSHTYMCIYIYIYMEVYHCPNLRVLLGFMFRHALTISRYLA